MICEEAGYAKKKTKGGRYGGAKNPLFLKDLCLKRNLFSGVLDRPL